MTHHPENAILEGSDTFRDTTNKAAPRKVGAFVMYEEDEDPGYNQPGKNWLEGHIYVIDYGDGKTFKIGHTTATPEIRLNQVKRGGSVILPMQLVMSHQTDTNCRYMEDLLHMHFDKTHKGGEWFELEFRDLVEMYYFFNSFGSVQLYDHWFDLIPKDIDEYIKHDTFKMPYLPIFNKKEYQELLTFDLNELFNWEKAI